LIGRRKKPENRWFVRMGDHVDGPHPESRIRAWRKEGKLPDELYVSRDGRTWHPVRWKRSAGGQRSR
jgi:hypothetical protein